MVFFKKTTGGCMDSVSFGTKFLLNMTAKPTTPEEYIAGLPEDRREIISDLRKTVRKNLPKGFKEVMAYGMIGYVVPHSLYPPGYHVDPKLPLGFIYSGELAEWFENEWKKYSDKKLDMGKACIRFKKPEDVPLKLIGELATKMTRRIG